MDRFPQKWGKDFSKSERIESLKAEQRMKTGKADPMQKFAEGTTRDIVAGINPQLRRISDRVENKRIDETVSEKLGIGSQKKEKYIVENPVHHYGEQKIIS